MAKKHSLRILLLAFLMIGSLLEGKEDPVSIYLTWQRQPDTTMTICWITSKSDISDDVYFKAAHGFDWQKATGSHHSMPQRFSYYIHQVELTNLSPQTTYEFHLGDYQCYSFQTLSSNCNKPLRFIVGGDMYNNSHGSTERLVAMNRLAASFDPSFVVLGGDIAYSSSRIKVLPENGYRWLDFLKVWKQTMCTSDGRLIPLIPAIGNHETNGYYYQTPAHAPFFYALFPMPGAQGYNVLDIGNYLSLYILDSGHTHSISGKQTEWLAEQLAVRQEVPHQFAVYHVPAYPSYGRFNDPISTSVRRSWVPLFEKFGLNVAFEHHIHAYKRTHPIRNGKVDSTGVVYLGDGAWAVDHVRPAKTPEEAWYLASSSATRNFILVTLHNDQRRFEAIDDQGKLIDYLIQEGSQKPEISRQ